jgi:hypothetical protein
MSNFMTVANGAHADVQLAAIQSLIDVDRKQRFSVKDAFQCLDLTQLGFHVLFHATWIYRAPSTPAAEDESERVVWTLAQSPADLATWERTWRGTRANAEARGQPPIFRSSLLQNQDFRFLLGRCDGASVATAALNRAGDAVGISNVFSDVEGVGPLFPGCVRMARSFYPELPLVGYERDAALAAATAAGFEPVGGLTVWNRVLA